MVLKLLNQVRPNYALFGLKDLQQCAVVTRMARDLDVPVRLEFVPTRREPDGLAMSSRNAYLTEEERAVAPWLRKVLIGCAREIEGGRPTPQALAHGWQDLIAAGFEPDYLDLVNLGTFGGTLQAGAGTALIVAAKLGRTRLIDNLPLPLGSESPGL